MIAVKRGPKPPVLTANEVAWTEEFTKDRSRTRYKTKEIKDALRAASFEKCVYCETRVTPTYVGEVEHIQPKSRVPERVVDWDNLAFVCWECNHTKSDYYDPAAPIVDPYVDNPEEHFMFAGFVVYERSDKGGDTIEVLGLRRGSLALNRADKAKEVHALLRRWEKTTPGPGRDFLLEDLRRQAADCSPYAAVARDWFRSWCQKSGQPAIDDLLP